MRKLRILALFHESHAPPDSRDELGRELDDRWAAYELVDALRALGHDVRVLGVADELAPIRHAIAAWRPRIVLNQLLEFHGAPLYDAHVVSYLELLKVAYTGCNPRGILLAADKTVAKKILSYHRIRTPRFAVFARGRRFRPPKRLEFPMFVKSDVEHASLGISQASIVRSPDALAKRVEYVHQTVGSNAIVEEYVEGREMTVGVLGNTRLTVLPAWELLFENLPKGSAPIATSRVKWDDAYQKKLGVRNARAELSEGLEKRIERKAKRVYRALGLSGYARLDLRIDAEDRVWVLEANPNPDLTPGADLPESAHAAGLEYPNLLQRIVNLGLSYEAAWKTVEG